MHDGPGGVGLALWIAMLAVNAAALFFRVGRTPTRQALLWLAAAVLFSLGLAWRNSETLQAFDFLATLFSLAMAAVSVRDPRAALFARRMRDTLLTGLDVAANTAVGVLPLAFREAVPNDAGKQAFGRARAFIRPVVIAVVALAIFGALLRAADPIFASWVDIPFDVGTIVSHLIVAGFFAWIVAGWARAGLVENPTSRRSTAPLPIQLGAADITAALGTLVVLFTAFVASQIGWLFGGEKLLHARTGLTAAAYARQGFFQMVWVVTLVVPVLVGTRAALGPGKALARRHTLLSIPVIVLLGAIIGSAMLRMKMYVHYYGLTTDRFYPAVFMLWLATVIVWLAVHRASRLGTAVRRRRGSVGDGVSRRAERRRPGRDRRARQRVARRACHARNGAGARLGASRITERTGSRHRRRGRGARRCAGFVRIDAEFSGGASMPRREDAAQSMEPGLARSAGITADGRVALLESRRRYRLPRRRCTNRRSCATG